MPEQSYPGVYVEEVSVQPAVVTAANTSVTAFVGRARRGPVADDADVPAPVAIGSWSEYEHTFGGLWSESPMSFAVRQFFQQGGTHALIVRVVAGRSVARAMFHDGDFALSASNPGQWGGTIEFAVDYGDGLGGALPAPYFNLTVRHLESAQHEGFARLSTLPGDASFVTTVLSERSQLVRATRAPTAPARPAERAFTLLAVGAGADGEAVGAAQITDPALAAVKRGMYALDSASSFNLLVIPPFAEGVDVSAADSAQAANYCAARGAMLLVDSPLSAGSNAPRIQNIRVTKPVFRGRTMAPVASLATRPLQQVIDHVQRLGPQPNAACFFPHLMAENPLRGNRVEAFAPSGAVAGVIARTDATRGVWKAPAGTEASLQAVQGVSVALSHQDNSRLNSVSVNALREFPRYGTVIWGARTLAAAGSAGGDWRYLAVRRTALFIERSVTQSLTWAVFEPNAEPLWLALRRSAETFLDGLFRSGAFQGASAREAYFAKCGRDTTSAVDIASGQAWLQLGFAPLKPAEFVVLSIRVRSAAP